MRRLERARGERAGFTSEVLKDFIRVKLSTTQLMMNDPCARMFVSIGPIGDETGL